MMRVLRGGERVKDGGGEERKREREEKKRAREREEGRVITSLFIGGHCCYISTPSLYPLLLYPLHLES